MQQRLEQNTSTTSTSSSLVLEKLVTHTAVSFDSHINKPVTFNAERFPSIHPLNGDHVSILSGSTYSAKAGKPNREEIKDSCHSAYIYNGNAIEGMVIAVADGFGGHRDAQEDHDICEASKAAAITATKALASYLSPEDLTDNCLYEIAKKCGAVANAQGKGQNTTLSCGRVFQLAPGNYQFVGFGVGDSMIASWDPIKKESRTLLAGISDGRSPEGIYGFHREELQIVRTIISEDSLLIAMSDGAYDELVFSTPFKSSLNTTWFKYELDNALIQNLFSALPVHALANDFNRAFIMHAIDKLEALKRNLSGDLAQNGCVLLLTSELPRLEHLIDLPFSANKAYIRYENQLFFVDKISNNIKLINEDDRDIKRFDEAMKINELAPAPSSRLLTSDDLKAIWLLTRHNPDKIAYGDDATLLITRVSQTAFASALKVKEQLDNSLSKAQQLSSDYARLAKLNKMNQALDAYNQAKTEFSRADGLFTMNDDRIGKIYCRIGLGMLMHQRYLLTPKSSAFYGESDYRNQALSYALDVVEELKHLTHQSIQQYSNAQLFLTEMKDFLNLAKKFITGIPDAKWKSWQPKNECNSLVETGLSTIDNLSLLCFGEVAGRKECLVM